MFLHLLKLLFLDCIISPKRNKEIIVLIDNFSLVTCCVVSNPIYCFKDANQNVNKLSTVQTLPTVGQLAILTDFPPPDQTCPSPSTSRHMAHLVDALLLETVRNNQRFSHRDLESDLESDSEYTYEEVEVEVFETDESDDGDNRREPDSIVEPPITETDDQIPDCVLESDQTSRLSIPCNISEDSCDVTTNSCPNLTDFGGVSSRADMADDEDELDRSDQSSRTLGYNTFFLVW